MNKRFEHILSPIKIGNVTLKNHLISTKCSPRFTNFEYDTEFYSHLAKNGASVVVVETPDYPGRELEYFPNGEPTRSSGKLNFMDPEIRKGFSQMVDKIHGYNTLVSLSMMFIEPIYIGISDFPEYEELMQGKEYVQHMLFRKREATTEELETMIDEFVWRCKDAKALGVDMVNFYMCYRSSMLALSLSPTFNRRTDKYGGETIEERAALTLELFRKVKEACGKDFLITVQISAEEEQPGYTVEDWLKYCKLCEGLVDIFQIRGYDSSSSHVSCINFKKGTPPNLHYAELFKKAGIKALVAPGVAFGNPDDIERYIAEGKTDLVAMARRFLSDSEYILKIEENRPEDIVPCMLCNECHGPRPSCAVNPKIANSTVYPNPTELKKIAIIGGGIAGMEAALIASHRGHSVTLYEKSDSLGGQLKIAGIPSFKWGLKDYKDFMVRKIMESDIEVHLSEEATSEKIKKGNYDAVICALGSKAKKIPVKGADQEFVWLADDAFTHEKELGKKVVVIGEGTTGRQLSLYLAEKGHVVTMLTRKQAKLFHDFHTQGAEEKAFKNCPNLSYISHATTKEICEGYVICDVKTGIPEQIFGFKAMGIAGTGFVMNEEFPQSLPPKNSSLNVVNGRVQPVPYDETNMKIEEVKIEFDSVVISGGRKEMTDISNKFNDCAKEVYIIGDNLNVADIKSATASAYKIAMEL